jgi:hypothetical protein
MQRTQILLAGLCYYAFLCGCANKTTENPIEAYKLWAGEKPMNEVMVIHGKYWSSSHWSKEYIVYLEIKAPSIWRKEFFKQNELIHTRTNLEIPSDAPTWFKPTPNFKTWVSKDSIEGSKYFEDTASGHMFIYEIQL